LQGQRELIDRLLKIVSPSSNKARHAHKRE